MQSAFADSAVLLIAARFVKGLAAAFTAPAAMSLLTTTFPEGPHRNKAFGIFNVFEAAGFSSGLLVGGLIAALDWRGIFLLPVPVAVLILVAALRFLPKDPPRAARQRTDFGGAVTLVAANLSSGLLYGAAMGFQFLIAPYLQNLNGWRPWQRGLVLLPAGLMVVLLGPRLGALMDRFGVRRVLLAGAGSFLPCYGLLLLVGPEPDLWVVLPVSVLWGAGFALGIATLMVSGTSGVPDEEQGLASGLVTSSLQIGGAAGLGVVTAVIAPGTQLHMLYPGVAVLLALAILTLLLQLIRGRAR